MVASDGPGEYPVITESRAGDDGIDVTVTSGTVAYVTTGGESSGGQDLSFCFSSSHVIGQYAISHIEKLFLEF